MSGEGISGNFKKTVALYLRIQKCEDLRTKYPNRIPCICEKAKNANIKPLNKIQFLVPDDYALSQFSFIIARNLNLSENASLFFLVNDKISLSGNQTMREVYTNFHDPEDKFLYITYATENVWG